MAIHITRVYTRSGDDGKTSLIGGERVGKDHPRLEAYGTLDELNSLVGMVRTLVPEQTAWSEAERERWMTVLQRMQNRIFDAGSLLAASQPETWATRPKFEEADMQELERSMDAMQEGLPDLRSFVLPGGSPVNAWLHLCRTVCRRGEREIAHLAVGAEVDAGLRRYVNRLSDWFFVASRHAAKLAGHGEFLWDTPLKA
jgi:cob(I)alamin adenosyltransferase